MVQNKVTGALARPCPQAKHCSGASKKGREKGMKDAANLYAHAWCGHMACSIGFCCSTSLLLLHRRLDILLLHNVDLQAGCVCAQACECARLRVGGGPGCKFTHQVVGVQRGGSPQQPTHTAAPRTSETERAWLTKRALYMLCVRCCASRMRGEGEPRAAGHAPCSLQVPPTASTL